MTNKQKPVFNKLIFWVVDFKKPDYAVLANFVIERVFERRDVDGIHQFCCYYSDVKATETLVNTWYLSAHRQHLVCALIDKPLYEFRCCAI